MVNESQSRVRYGEAFGERIISSEAERASGHQGLPPTLWLPGLRDHPLGVGPGVSDRQELASPALLAHVLVSKCCDHLPVIGGSSFALVCRNLNPAGESPVTTAKPPPVTALLEARVRSGFALPELHHQWRRDPK
jgi:hypothetical protein